MSSIFSVIGKISLKEKMKYSSNGTSYLKFLLQLSNKELLTIISFKEIAQKIEKDFNVGTNVLIIGALHGSKATSKYMSNSLFVNDIFNIDSLFYKIPTNNSTSRSSTSKNLDALDRKKLYKELLEDEQFLEKQALCESTDLDDLITNSPNEEKSNNGLSNIKNGGTITKRDCTIEEASNDKITKEKNYDVDKASLENKIFNQSHTTNEINITNHYSANKDNKLSFNKNLNQNSSFEKKNQD